MIDAVDWVYSAPRGGASIIGPIDRARGDDQPKNNGADLVFRLDGRSSIVGPMFRPRETDPAKRGTVEVRAPGGS